tara:strand:- start:6079 stop:7329 length:1251 start_codon:yes stop_codon:yes gene_type:complete
MRFEVGVIGLGYVGLPLAVSFSKNFKTIGFDINKNRIIQINNGLDITNEISRSELQQVLANGFEATFMLEKLKNCNVYIVTVPTPIDKNKNPDLSHLIKATESVSSIISKGDFIIYESTVYPGATEEIGIPILENKNLKLNEDFYVGFSPERINPGDKEHTFEKIDKVVSGSNEYALDIISRLYSKVIKAKIHPVTSIKVAEAAKVIENTQRDLNIAFVNELSQIFKKMDIDTTEVLQAASTKWNFLNFKPGLVGGHCIGIDPYYLAYKAKEIGYNPEVILSGRKTNESVPEFIFQTIIGKLKEKEIKAKNVLILGATFKENCPDIRNSKSEDLYNIFNTNQFSCKIHDPVADQDEMKNLYNKDFIENLDTNFEIIVIAVGHNQFFDLKFENIGTKDCIIFDVKSIYPISKGYLRL